MKTVWTKGLKVQEREEITRDFQASAMLRKRLIVLLRDKIDAGRTCSTSKERYESPSWAYIQADEVGYGRALQEVISLLFSESVEK